MPDTVTIVGAGMMTAVGLSYRETTASVTARVARFTESTLRDQNWKPFTLATVPDDCIPPIVAPNWNPGGATAAEIRMLRLAATPIRECLAPTGGRSRITMCLALPEGLAAGRRATFLQLLATQVDSRIDPRASDASHSGRAGGLIAVGQAVATIEEGIADVVIAGGIDTPLDLMRLGELDRDKRLKSEANADGFIPGEAACFLLFASRRAAVANGWTALCTVSPVGLAFEPGHLYSDEPYRGHGLTMAIEQLFGSVSVEAPIADVYSSMNGEGHWAKEWGVSYIRHRSRFQPDHAMHHPADCCGDTGAASGPLMVGLAATGIAKGRARGPGLVYCSSDRGPRAALVVSDALH